MSFTDPPTTPSQGETGYLATLWIDPTNSSPPNYQMMAELKSFDIQKIEVPVVDFTTLVSPNATEEPRPGITKAPVIDLSGNWTAVAIQRRFSRWRRIRKLCPGKSSRVCRREITPISAPVSASFRASRPAHTRTTRRLNSQLNCRGSTWMNETIS